MNRLLLLSGNAPLDEFEISCGEIMCFSDDYGDHTPEEEMSRFVGPWIGHVLTMCQARTIKFNLRTVEGRCRLVDVCFVSQVLTKVELTDATLRGPHSLDFSRCPVLEDLGMSRCRILVERISSKSLRRMSMEACDFHSEIRTRICTPSLVSLRLCCNFGRVPCLESMPSLVAAQVRIQEQFCHDMCDRSNKEYYGDCKDKTYRGCHASRDANSVMLLEGLSGATNLELLSDPHVVSPSLHIFVFKNQEGLPLLVSIYMLYYIKSEVYKYKKPKTKKDTK